MRLGRLFIQRALWGERPILPQVGYVFLVSTMRAQGHSGMQQDWSRKLAYSTRQREEQLTWDQLPGSYLKESWSLVR